MFPLLKRCNVNAMLYVMFFTCLVQSHVSKFLCYVISWHINCHIFSNIMSHYVSCHVATYVMLYYLMLHSCHIKCHMQHDMCWNVYCAALAPIANYQGKARQVLKSSSCTPSLSVRP